MYSLRTEILQNHANAIDQVHNGNRGIKQSLASIKKKLVTLTIAQEAGNDLYTLFADQNPKDLLLPLMQMDSHLIPFVLELTKSRKISINEQAMQNIYDQFQDLLASCYEASAVFTRREKKEQYRRSIQDSSSSLNGNSNAAFRALNASWQRLQQENQDYHFGYKGKRASKSQRSGIWIKKLPHGLLKIQLAPITDGGGHDMSRGLHACFTFQPDHSLDTKCISACFDSGIQAMDSPKASRTFRAFSWFSSNSLTTEILRTDDIPDSKMLSQEVSLLHGISSSPVELMMLAPFSAYVTCEHRSSGPVAEKRTGSSISASYEVRPCFCRTRS